uniref:RUBRERYTHRIN TRANSPORT, IRON, FERROXIDASE.1A n=1 Tax=virus sp. ct5rm7 TaxID=2827298 RepID=A0A8S5RGM3_9VIRU|nr:MAG TPA: RUBRERYTHRIN TRANSPORT, IRON, FERROXIDASE.1A [virus sp. ct5rm7]
METVDVYTINGDFVTCSGCGKVMLLPHGADRCPACKAEGTLSWTDANLQETDIDGLLERHCNLHRKNDPQPEDYLSLSVLATEYVPYLTGKSQTAREALDLLLDISKLFEEHWRNTRCFQSENIYTTAIKALLDKLDLKLKEGDAIPIEYQDCCSLGEFFRVIVDEHPAKEEVMFSSDMEGNYYFNGCKIRVENSHEYAYRLLKTKIQTTYCRPVDFYFRFLARSGPYGTYGNPYYPSTTDLICRRYLPEPTE